MYQFRSRHLKLAISIVVSGIFLILIYRRVDFVALKDTFLHISLLPALIFFLLILIQLFLTSVRWNLFTRQLGNVNVNLAESVQQVLGSYSANLVVPGKWGEIVRIPWMKKYRLQVPVLLMVFLEKALDTLSVVTILFFSVLILVISGFATSVPLKPVLLVAGMIVGLIYILIIFRFQIIRMLKTKLINKDKTSKRQEFLQKGVTLVEITGEKFWSYYAFSLMIWIIQVLQFYFIFLMLGLHVHVVYTYAGSCLALLAGVIPVSIAGMGTRDAVIIGFFQHVASFELLAGAGILSLLRIILPSLIGIPFFINQTRNS